MKTAIVALTLKGRETAIKIKQAIPEANVYLSEKVSDGREDFSYQGPFSQLMGELFQSYSHLICICATGIVVRGIAPLLKHKSIDPAVVVVDDGGKFIIPLVGGHLAGANELAKELAATLGAQAVITTASDNLDVTAAEMWGKELDMVTENFAGLPAVNGAIVNNEELAVISDWDISSENKTLGQKEKTHYFTPSTFAQENIEQKPYSAYVYVTDRINRQPNQLHMVLRPKTLVVGIGVRRGIPLETIEAVVKDAFAKASLSFKSIKSIASIDAKSDEVGLLAFADKFKLPISFFNKTVLQEIISAQELKTSDFVERQMGVGAVCEPAALAVVKDSTLIMKKYQDKGVTVAVARVPFTL